MNDTPTSAETRLQRLRVGAALASLLVGALLLATKFYAWRLTGSASILSDALESIINVVASGFAIYSVIMAGKPPDEDHPYGHGKIEFFSAGFEGSLIMVAALGIVWAALPKILSPTEIPALDLGLALMAGTSAVNLGLGLFLIRLGKKTKSLTLVADGKHVLTDVYTSLGVILGLLVVRMTGQLWLDGLTALLVAANILFTGWRLMRHAFAGLMDESDPELLDEICELLEKNRPPQWIDVHRLRAWRSGAYVHTDFHLILPHDITLVEAHDQVKHIEALLEERFDNLIDVLIHVDPCREDECCGCEKDPCQNRGAAPSVKYAWDRETIVPNKRLAHKTPK
jgi:cation diffusion facilitator family transporter